MSQTNHVINFSLDRETIKKFMSMKGAKLEKRNNRLEVVFPDSRIKLDLDKKQPTTATYYNNKSSNLHFLGTTVTAKATHVLVDKKESEKTRGVELLDIPSIHTAPPPSSPSIKSTKLKKATTTSSNVKSHNNTKKPNIPSVTPQNTPRPSSNNSLLSPPVEKLSDRVIQLLAIKPYQITTMAKALETTSWDIKRIVDDVGICIPDQSSQKKKYCLKPQLYKNVRIWDWPLYTDSEKDTVYANAKEAYDILQFPPDAIERANLSEHRSRSSTDPRFLAKKKLKKEEKKQLDLKGKGKPYAYPSNMTTVAEPVAPTPSPITTPPASASAPAAPAPAALPAAPPSQPSLPSQPSQSSLPSLPAPPASSAARSPVKTKSASRNGLLKPSSSNKKVGTKGLPHVSPPPPPPTTAPPALPPPPPPPVSTATAVTPMKRKEVIHPKQQTGGYGLTSSKRTKSGSEYGHGRPVELSEIPTQAIFDKYCNKFLKHQKEYQQSKMNFKRHHPDYIQALQQTAPPKGSKRSYYDLKLEYHDMVKDHYLKSEDESAWREAEAQLRDCNEKRRRLNFMWSSIQKNLNDHHYKLNQK